mgnify:CR=1 FL=1
MLTNMHMYMCMCMCMHMWHACFHLPPIRVKACSGACVWRQVDCAFLAGSRRTPVTPPHAAARIGRAIERRLHLDHPTPRAAGAAGARRRCVGPHAPRAVDEPHLGLG